MGEAAIGTRKLIVEVVGDSRSLERSFANSSRATRQFGNEVTGTVATVDRSFTKMQRTLAGGFIGGAVIGAGVTALRSVIEAAGESQQVLGQTQVALESAGLSWERYGQRIQKAISEQSRLGFDDEALLRTFSLFVRQSGDVDEALRRNAIATDVARARFMDLESAAALVNKAALGQAGALRRVGIDAPKAASGIELLALLERQFGGAAEKASNDAITAQERLAVSFENVQEALGATLLPAVGELAGHLSDASEEAVVLIGVLGQLADTEIPPIEIPFTTVEVPGTGSRVGDIGSKVAGIAVFAQFAGPSGVIALAVKKAVDETRGEPGDSGRPELAAAFDDTFNKFTDSFIETGQAAAAKARDKVSNAFGQPGFKPVPNDLGERLQRQFDDALDALDLSFDIARTRPGIGEELAVLRQEEERIQARIASHGRTTELARKLFEVGQRRQALFDEVERQEDAEREKDRRRRQKRKEDRIRRARLAAEAAAEETQRDQFRLLGLSPTGDKPIPVVANLRRQLSQLTDRLVDEGEMTPKIRAQLNKISNVLRGGAGKVTEDTRETIRDMFGDIRQVFDEESNKDLVPDIRAVTLSDKILNALGFGKDADVTGKLGIDTRGLGRIGRTSVAAPPPQVFTGAITVVADNPDAFLREMQKKANRTTATSRGRFPGKSLGLG